MKRNRSVIRVSLACLPYIQRSEASVRHTALLNCGPSLSCNIVEPSTLVKVGVSGIAKRQRADRAARARRRGPRYL